MHYTVLEAIRTVYGIWQMSSTCIYHYVAKSSCRAKFDKNRL